MDPVTLGAVVAALIAKKAFEQVGEKAGEAGWEAIEALTNRVRGWFRSRKNDTSLATLDMVESAPDSQLALKRLAAEITAAAEDDPVQAQELDSLVQRIESGGPTAVATFIAVVRDDANVGRVIQVTGDYHEHGDG